MVTTVYLQDLGDGAQGLENACSTQSDVYLGHLIHQELQRLVQVSLYIRTEAPVQARVHKTTHVVHRLDRNPLLTLCTSGGRTWLFMRLNLMLTWASVSITSWCSARRREEKRSREGKARRLTNTRDIYRNNIHHNNNWIFSAYIKIHHLIPLWDFTKKGSWKFKHLAQVNKYK